MPSAIAQFVYDAKMVALRPGARRLDATLAQAERLPIDRLRSLTQRRQTALAVHAFDRSPFYRALYKGAGLERDDVACPRNFTLLPQVTKQQLRDGAEAVVAEGVAPQRLLASRTGGSTGEPLVVQHDRLAPIDAMWRRVYRWWGISAADHEATAYRSRRSSPRTRLDDLRWWPTRRLRLDAQTMTDESMDEFLRRWATVRPALLNGYVGAVHELACHVLDSGTWVRPPRAVGVTAAPVTASERATIAEAFGAPVYDQYRSAEVSWMAAECGAHEGLHVLADLRTVEVLGADGIAARAGEQGDVVVTDLVNRAFPIIRYAIGDRTHLLEDPCPCGRSLPRIAPVAGRRNDVLRARGGVAIAGGLTTLFNTRPTAVRQFQVHQHADASVTLRYVPGTGDVRGAVEAARGELARMLPGTPVRSEPVSAISHRGGKARVVLSDLTPPRTRTGARTSSPPLERPIHA